MLALLLHLGIFMAKKKGRTIAQDQAIRAKVTELQQSQGYSLQRAQAAAFRMYRDGELNILKTSQRAQQQQRKLVANGLDAFLLASTSRRLQRKRFQRRLQRLKKGKG
jgi:G:T/U-mismatch repair DNA glycosylase